MFSLPVVEILFTMILLFIIIVKFDIYMHVKLKRKKNNTFKKLCWDGVENYKEV